MLGWAPYPVSPPGLKPSIASYPTSRIIKISMFISTRKRFSLFGHRAFSLGKIKYWGPWTKRINDSDAPTTQRPFEGSETRCAGLPRSFLSLFSNSTPQE
jgi:hypothetical protein